MNLTLCKCDSRMLMDRFKPNLTRFNQSHNHRITCITNIIAPPLDNLI
ncbi:hypothetical protein EBX93_12875 [bacterium]|nr:hypothetical protein [bacterium]